MTHNPATAPGFFMPKSGKAMSDRIPEIETSVDLLRSIIWQYDNAESVKSLISQKNEWYKKEQTEFWDNWFRDVFDIRTANDFGLEIWSIILGVSFLVPDCPGKVLTTEQKRLICRLRYYQLITRCTIPEVNEITMKLFATKDGKAYALDPLDMSCILYVFTEQPTSAVALILAKYDLLPRPATVGLKYRVIRYVPFGFGQHYQNFENAPFWDGGELIQAYNERIDLVYNASAMELSGTVHITGESVADLDVTIIVAGWNDAETVHRRVTDARGKFVINGIFQEGSAIARTTTVTEMCKVLNIESRVIINGIPPPQPWHVIGSIVIDSMTPDKNTTFGYSNDKNGVIGKFDIYTQDLTSRSILRPTYLYSTVVRYAGGEYYMFRFAYDVSGGTVKPEFRNKKCKLIITLDSISYDMGAVDLFEESEGSAYLTWSRAPRALWQAFKDHRGIHSSIYLQFSLV